MTFTRLRQIHGGGDSLIQVFICAVLHFFKVVGFMQRHTTLTHDYMCVWGGSAVLSGSESHLASAVLPRVAAVLTVGVLTKKAPKTGNSAPPRRQVVQTVSSLVLQV